MQKKKKVTAKKKVTQKWLWLGRWKSGRVEDFASLRTSLSSLVWFGPYNVKDDSDDSDIMVMILTLMILTQVSWSWQRSPCSKFQPRRTTLTWTSIWRVLWGYQYLYLFLHQYLYFNWCQYLYQYLYVYQYLYLYQYFESSLEVLTNIGYMTNLT